MREFLIISGALVAIWFAVGFIKFLVKKLRRHAMADDDRESVDKWVKDSAHYKKTAQGRGSPTRRRR